MVWFQIQVQCRQSAGGGLANPHRLCHPLPGLWQCGQAYIIWISNVTIQIDGGTQLPSLEKEKSGHGLTQHLTVVRVCEPLWCYMNHEDLQRYDAAGPSIHTEGNGYHWPFKDIGQWRYTCLPPVPISTANVIHHCCPHCVALLSWKVWMPWTLQVTICSKFAGVIWMSHHVNEQHVIESRK